MSYSWLKRKRRKKPSAAVRSDEEFQGLLVSDQELPERWGMSRASSGKGQDKKKSPISRSKVGSVDHLEAFIAPNDRQSLSGRHVKYQARNKIKAPKTNWVSINSDG